MRSNVVDATPVTGPRRSRASASVCHDAVKRESSISDCVSAGALTPPNHDSSPGVGRRGRGSGPAGAAGPEKMFTPIRARFDTALARKGSSVRDEIARS